MQKKKTVKLFSQTLNYILLECHNKLIVCGGFSTIEEIKNAYSDNLLDIENNGHYAIIKIQKNFPYPCGKESILWNKDLFFSGLFITSNKKDLLKFIGINSNSNLKYDIYADDVRIIYKLYYVPGNYNGYYPFQTTCHYGKRHDFTQSNND